MSSSDHKILNIINPESRAGLLALTASFIFIMVYGFFEFFILTIPVIHHDIAGHSFPPLAFEIFVLILVYLIVVFISADDTLYYGNPQKNKYVRAFQKHLPTGLIMEMLNVDSSTAQYLWFNVFNTWREKSNAKNADYNRTFARGYACRLVFYVVRACRFFIVIALMALVTEGLLTCWKVLPHFTDLSLKVLYIVLTVVVCIVVLWKNNPEKETGVWQRFREINERHRHYIRSHLDEFRKDPEALNKEPNA